MAASSYDYNVPKNAPKGRPVDQDAHGSIGHQDSLGKLGLDDDTTASQRPTQARAGAHRGASSGRWLPKDHVEARDVVSGCHLVVRDPRLVMSDQARPYGRPATDWSGRPSIAETQHRSMCAGGNLCPAPAFHFGLQDGSR